MYRFIARQNVEHFRALLDVERDEARRRLLRRLLLEEEAKLDHSMAGTSCPGDQSERVRATPATPG